MDRGVGFEADGKAAVAKIERRTLSCADGTAIEVILSETHGAKMFTVAAIFPEDLSGRFGLAFEIQLAQYVTSILTLDGTLPRSEKSSLVLRAEYSHFRCSL